MYSVEDLLISHGYKLPQHPPAPAPATSSRQAPSPLPPSYSKHHEILENRTAHRAVNGYEREAGSYGNGGGARQPEATGANCPNNNNNETRDRCQSRQEGDSRSQGGPPESLAPESGFSDGPRGQQPHSKDVSYWRRKGQDFTVLLDYADFREGRGGGQGGFSWPEGPQQPRGQVSGEERQRAAQERQRWAALSQARSREREAALHQWRMAAERKCQSLGTEEWRPAVSFGRQLSESEGDRWAQEQLRIHARTPDGVVVHPRTKAKSQSLPRMLQPDGLQYVDMTSGQELYKRVNGHPLAPHDFCRAPRWPENGRPASANQLSMTPKPRFTRPPRPPSYEVHQQIRGSCEVLSGRDSAVPQARDRTPLPLSRADDPQLDYFAQDSGPPGYIPPPSYKRAPIMRAGRQGYGEVAVDYRYRGDVYQQMHVAPDGSHWFTRQPMGPWPDPQKDRSTPRQKPLYPVYTTYERPGGGVQYIPFDDPRVRHMSSTLGGNSLTDADKIRHIRNELPGVIVSEPASDDSAFLPPPLGPFVAARSTKDASQTSPSNFDNDNNRWHSDLHKETVDNFPATDQNCNNRYPKNQCPPAVPSSAFQATVLTGSSSSRQGSSSDHSFAETITQVKKIVPNSGPETIRNSKRRVSETIFCLVSVPIHTPTNVNKDSAADQNNNETIPSLTVTNADSITVRHTENQNLRSKSMTEMPIRPHYAHYHTSSTSSMRNYKRAPLRKEIIDAWALQANEDKELCYAGSWPGNQYRNQETQTNSPLTVAKSLDPQSSSGGQEPGQSVSDTTTDSGVGTDNSASYGYPMAGQKNLHLSSNSAFSRLSLSSAQPPSQLSQETLGSPSKTQKNQGSDQPSSPRKGVSSLSEGEEQVAFGQFLLKPVNRRPWDAIGELECINKVLEDTINKRPNVDQRSEKRKDMQRNPSELSIPDQSQSPAPSTAAPHPGRKAMSLPLMHIDELNNMKTRSQSCGPPIDPDFREARSVSSMRQSLANTRLTDYGLSSLPQPSPRDGSFVSPLTLHTESNHFYRQDIPVPQESMLRDVGLTVYTETPGGPGKPIKRSLSVPIPLGPQEVSQSLRLSGGNKTMPVRSSSEHNSYKQLQAGVGSDRKPKVERICRPRSENSRLSRAAGSPHITRLSREAAFVFGEDTVGDRYAICEPLTYRNESTIADQHLENLLTQEKACVLPTEDLSNLYEVRCAKGIPENESIEQRAARILGIDVPVEALGVADKAEDEPRDQDIPIISPTTEDVKAFPVETERHSPHRETQQVAGQSEQVKEESVISQGQETEEDRETGPDEDHTDGEDRQNASNNHSEDQNTSEHQQATVLGLPEFPPSTLPLSLPFTPIDKTPQAKRRGEKKGRGGASKLIESLHDKLSSSASSSAVPSGRSATERMARLKELDSVSRIRRLSLKSSDSGGETEPEEREGDTEESDAQVEVEGSVTQRQDQEEDKEFEEAGDQEENGAMVEVGGDVTQRQDQEEDKELEEDGDREENAAQVQVEGEVKHQQDQEEGRQEGEIKEKAEKKEKHDVRMEPKEENAELFIEEEHTDVGLQIDEGVVNEEIALKAAEGEVTFVSKSEEAEGGLVLEEEDQHPPMERPRGQESSENVSRADSLQEAGRQEAPRPKQRTRTHKPPLLPKPRSVPKREITLPLSFSRVTRGSTSLEDEDMLSVSDSYDPSRVERV